MAFDPDDDAFAEQLFEAARRERPDAGAKRRALREVARPSRVLRLERWFLVAAALVAAGVVLVRVRGSSPVKPAISAEPVTALPAPPEALSQRAPRSLVSAPPAPSSSAPLLAPSSAPKPRAATLEEELAFLDRARQALLQGNTSAALASLAQYEKVATSRRLGAEAALLRIQVLAAAGRGREASERAREFVRQNPNSPLVDRARSFSFESVPEKQEKRESP